MIREYQDADLEKVMDIANKAWKEIRKMARTRLGDRISDIMRPEGDDKCKGLEVKGQALQNPENFWICERNGKIVGFITFRIDKEKNFGEILNNAADADSGEKGVGQEMYKAVLDYFRELKLDFVTVRTGLDYAHERARKAYERVGFDKSMESITYYMEL